MSFMFLMTMFIVQPSFTDMLAGMFIPRMPSGALWTVIALVGTTVVPYNLFLHSSSVKEKWRKAVPLGQALTESRIDTVASILLGGLITLAVVTTAATTFFASGVEIVGAETMARQLEPLLGAAAKYFFAVGLLSAGVTSAITAPLAAAYTMSGLLGNEYERQEIPGHVDDDFIYWNGFGYKRNSTSPCDCFCTSC
jgi:Mn2+/Fe2+ NRAMP family transporter